VALLGCKQGVIDFSGLYTPIAVFRLPQVNPDLPAAILIVASCQAGTSIAVKDDCFASS
jgi:hypothetical protein